MEEEQAYLAAVIADPTREDLRLRYATALRLRGEHQGELIEVQMALEALDEDADSYPALRKREAELLMQYGKQIAGARRAFAYRYADWNDGVEGFVPRTYYELYGDNDYWRFRRGMLGAASMDIKAFLNHAPSIMRTYPVESLHLFLFPDQYVSALATSAYLTELTELGLEGDPADVHLLCSSIRFSRLVSLTLNSLPGQLLAVSQCSGLSGLERLVLYADDPISFSRQIDLADIRAFAEAGQFGSLRKLALYRGRIGADGLEAVLESSVLNRLDDIDLMGNPVGIAGFKLLANSPFASRLVRLNLSAFCGADMDDEENPWLADYVAGAQAAVQLSASPYLSSLRSLGLGMHNIGDEGAIALSQSQSLAGLTHLDLRWNEIGDDGLMALANSPLMSNLRVLDLGLNQISDRGLEALAASPYITKLNRLSLASNLFTEKGFISLVRSPNAARLRVIECRRNDLFSPISTMLQHAGFAALAESPYLTRLNVLDLCGHTISRESARILVKSPYLNALIRISGLDISEEDRDIVDMLQARWPTMPSENDFVE